MDKKTIWITGASSGIGLAVAERFVDQGHLVIASGRQRESLQKLQARAPGRVSILDFELSDADMMNQLPLRLSEVTDYLDMLILAAGTCEYVDHPDCSVDLYRRVMEVNYFSQVDCAVKALPLLKKSEHPAQLVGVGSLAAQLAFPRAQAYGASKAALEYWLDTMRIDLAPWDIDVSVVSPGFVDTPLTRKNDFDMPTLMNVDDAADLIVKGIVSRKRYIRFPNRLYWALKVLSALPSIWFGKITPKLQRANSL